ncbi:hypothetical protein [Stenotrophomonas sp.]|uniref:hypothetical protein n=1 Tax=Stenotrophomonas sp. TaxID=69392 RepID=UPI003D6CC716
MYGLQRPWQLIQRGRLVDQAKHAGRYRQDWRSFLKWALPLALVLLTAGAVHTIGYLRRRREVEQRRLVERRLAEVTGNLSAQNL